MPLWSLIVWLLIGLGAGYVAGQIMGGNRPFGLIGDLVLGLIGALVGGWGLGLLGLGGGGGLIGSFVVALIGAMALVWIARKIKQA